MLGCLSGCFSGLLHSSAQPTQVYLLRATATVNDSPEDSAHTSLHVSRPLAAPGLDSDHIVLVQSDHRMNYYIGGRWPGTLPAIVEALTLETLRASGRWASVQNSSSAFPSDYILQIVIRRFEADYTGNLNVPEVHVVLDCTIGKRLGREIVATFVAEGSSPATANRLGDVVAAFETAANKAIGAMAERAAQATPIGPSKG
jgi:cholesterol transport system auxiliary component